MDPIEPYSFLLSHAHSTFPVKWCVFSQMRIFHMYIFYKKERKEDTQMIIEPIASAERTLLSIMYQHYMYVHVRMSHGTHEWVMAHVNEAWHIWMSHSTYDHYVSTLYVCTHQVWYDVAACAQQQRLLLAIARSQRTRTCMLCNFGGRNTAGWGRGRGGVGVG